MRLLLSFAAVAVLVIPTAASAAAVESTSRAAIASGQVKEARMHVEGIACDACAKRLREALSKLDGVIAVVVDRDHAELVVDFDPTKTNEQAIRAEVSRHGFTVK